MRCEVPGCTREAVQDHHIFTRGAKREDAEVPENIFPCCVPHHTGSISWHVTGRDSFAKMFGLEGRVERAREAVLRKSWEGNDRATQGRAEGAETHVSASLTGTHEPMYREKQEDGKEVPGQGAQGKGCLLPPPGPADKARSVLEVRATEAI